MSSLIIIAISVVVFYLYSRDIKDNKFSTKDIVVVGMFSAISLVLYNIAFIKYPQGGGITLFSMVPTMLLSILYGRSVGVTGGLVFGLLKLLNGFNVVHPAQFLLDYLLSAMVLGLAGTFASHKRSNIVKGGLIAVSLSVFASFVSGAVFFGQYAPPGMNPWVYSAIYNISSAGVEGILSVGMLVLLPIGRFEKALKLAKN